MKKLSILKAAEVMRDNYYAPNPSDVRQSIDIAGAQAVMLKSGILAIPGTNELSDWADFNLDFTHDVPIVGGFALALGDSGARWHAGFLEHAQLLFGFAKAHAPEFIVGHSLGGASAQILGLSLRTPTITFGAALPYQGGKQHIAGEGWVCNVCRMDDDVPHFPSPLQGFRHVGSVYWLSGRGDTDKDRHSMPNYIEALNAPQPQTQLPEKWPR